MFLEMTFDIIIFIHVLIHDTYIQDIPGQAYLVRRAKYFVPSDATARKDCLTDDDNDTQEFHVRFRQDPHEAVSTSETPFIIEHHILWSISYSVPVLFFNGWKSGNLKRQLTCKIFEKNPLSAPSQKGIRRKESLYHKS